MHNSLSLGINAQNGKRDGDLWLQGYTTELSFFSFDKRIVLIRLSGPPNFIINDRQSMPQVPKSDFEGFNTVDKISV